MDTAHQLTTYVPPYTLTDTLFLQIPYYILHPYSKVKNIAEHFIEVTLGEF